MAARRMFANAVINSDSFLDMPAPSQNLYFFMSMQADDEGFIANPKKIIRMLGGSENDLVPLVESGFIIKFSSGILCVRHWKVHNSIRNDRLKATMHHEERALITDDASGIYNLCVESSPQNGNQLASNCQPNDGIDKFSLGEDNYCQSDLDIPEEPAYLNDFNPDGLALRAGTGEQSIISNCYDGQNDIPFPEEVRVDDNHNAPPRQVKPEKRKPKAKKAPDGEEKPVDEWKFLGKNREAGLVFHECTGIKPVGSEYGLWNKGLKELAESGFTAADIPRIVAEMKSRRLTIGSPGSLLKIGREMRYSGLISSSKQSIPAEKVEYERFKTESGEYEYKIKERIT